MGVKPDPDHNCECSLCVERSEILRELLEWLTPGVVLTVGGRAIDHTKFNDLKERAEKSWIKR